MFKVILLVRGYIGIVIRFFRWFLVLVFVFLFCIFSGGEGRG